MLLLTACLKPDAYPPFRYRLTVEVETADGLRSGSVVREVDYNASVDSPATCAICSTHSAYTRGEAVAVDLPGGRTLYALMDSGVSNLPFALYSVLPPRDRRARGWIRPSTPAFNAMWRRMMADRSVHVLPRSFGNWDGGGVGDWPMMVTFANPADPVSVTKVDPDNLAASFGPGTRLHRITFQMTSDPVTSGIDARLPWLVRIEHTGFSTLEPPPSGPIKAPKGPVPLGRDLTSGNFIHRIPLQ